MSLHDLPDPTASLSQAASMLRPGGSVVITHPKGAGHVAMQVLPGLRLIAHFLNKQLIATYTAPCLLFILHHQAPKIS